MRNAPVTLARYDRLVTDVKNDIVVFISTPFVLQSSRTANTFGLSDKSVACFNAPELPPRQHARSGAVRSTLSAETM